MLSIDYKELIAQPARELFYGTRQKCSNRPHFPLELIIYPAFARLRSKSVCNYFSCVTSDNFPCGTQPALFSIASYMEHS